MEADVIASEASITHYSLNSWNDLLAVGTSEGFKIFRTNPFSETARREIPGGVSIVELLERTNLVALVTICAPNVIQVWDDTIRQITNQVDLGSVLVTSLKLRRDLLVCGLAQEVRLYELSKDLRLLCRFPTFESTKGPLAISTSFKCSLASPGERRGYVQILHIDSSRRKNDILEVSKSISLRAHDHEIQALSLTEDGALLATVSTNGTLIRVWNTSSCQKVAEFRRGRQPARIQAIAFAKPRTLSAINLAVLSDKGTIHIFSSRPALHEIPDDNADAGNGLWLKLHWDRLRVRIEVPEGEQCSPRVRLDRLFLFGWLDDASFIVVSATGHIWKYVLTSPKPNEPKFLRESSRKWY